MVHCLRRTAALYARPDIRALRYDRTHLQAGQDRHAVGPSEHQGMDARLRTRDAARGGTVNGLDVVRRYAPADQTTVCDEGRGDRLLPAAWTCLPGVRGQARRTPRHFLFGQLRLQSPRRLDALIIARQRLSRACVLVSPPAGAARR